MHRDENNHLTWRKLIHCFQESQWQTMGDVLKWAQAINPQVRHADLAAAIRILQREKNFIEEGVQPPPEECIRHTKAKANLGTA